MDSGINVEHREEDVEAFRQERVSEDRVRHGATAFMKPRVSPVSMARMTALIGSFATRIARPCALASRSVMPARPSCGSMNIV